MNLAEMRARVREDLKDSDAANYRWSDDEVDGQIERVLREFSKAYPKECQNDIVTTADSKEIDISSLTQLLSVFSIEFPPLLIPPSYPLFEMFADKLYMLHVKGDGTTATIRWGRKHSLDPPWVKDTDYILGDYVWPTTFNGYRYVCTTAGKSGATEPTWPTTIGDTVTDPSPGGPLVWTCITLASAVPEQYEEIIVLGSTGYLAASASIGATDQTTTGGKTTVANYHSWGRERLARYEKQLNRISRPRRMQTSTLVTD